MAISVGTNKKKQGKIATCPCCGLEDEDQIHLYRCNNVKMQQTFKASISKVQSKLVKDGVPSTIYGPFINQICKVAHKEPHNTTIDCTDEINGVIQSQEQLGMEQFIRGFIHNEWIEALSNNWTPPREIHGGGKERKKDPREQSISLVRGLWDIFEDLWMERNNILHSKENETTTLETNGINQRLLEFKYNSTDMLLANDRHIIDYPASDVIKWTLDRKKMTLKNLKILHRLFKAKMTREGLRVHYIAEYFQEPNNEIETNE